MFSVSWILKRGGPYASWPKKIGLFRGVGYGWKGKGLSASGNGMGIGYGGGPLGC